MNTTFNTRRSGFTLIEIVVATAIFSVISAITFPALISFLDARERIEAKHAENVALQKTFLFLTNDLRFASNRLSKDKYGEKAKTTITINDNDALFEITAASPDLTLLGESVPRRVRWELNEGVLQRIQYPVMDPDSDTRMLRQNLLHSVEDVDVVVRYIEDGRDEQSSDWEEQSRLPDVLEIVIDLESGLQFRRVISMQGADKNRALSAQ